MLGLGQELLLQCLQNGYDIEHILLKNYKTNPDKKQTDIDFDRFIGDFTKVHEETANNNGLTSLHLRIGALEKLPLDPFQWKSICLLAWRILAFSTQQPLSEEEFELLDTFETQEKKRQIQHYIETASELPKGQCASYLTKFIYHKASLLTSNEKELIAIAKGMACHDTTSLDTFINDVITQAEEFHLPPATCWLFLHTLLKEKHPLQSALALMEKSVFLLEEIVPLSASSIARKLGRISHDHIEDVIAHTYEIISKYEHKDDFSTLITTLDAINRDTKRPYRPIPHILSIAAPLLQKAANFDECSLIIKKLSTITSEAQTCVEKILLTNQNFPGPSAIGLMTCLVADIPDDDERTALLSMAISLVPMDDSQDPSWTHEVIALCYVLKKMHGSLSEKADSVKEIAALLKEFPIRFSGRSLITMGIDTHTKKLSIDTLRVAAPLIALIPKWKKAREIIQYLASLNNERKIATVETTASLVRQYGYHPHLLTYVVKEPKKYSPLYSLAAPLMDSGMNQATTEDILNSLSYLPSELLGSFVNFVKNEKQSPVTLKSFLDKVLEKNADYTAFGKHLLDTLRSHEMQIAASAFQFMTKYGNNFIDNFSDSLRHEIMLQTSIKGFEVNPLVCLNWLKNSDKISYDDLEKFVKKPFLMHYGDIMGTGLWKEAVHKEPNTAIALERLLFLFTEEEPKRLEMHKKANNKNLPKKIISEMEDSWYADALKSLQNRKYHRKCIVC